MNRFCTVIALALGAFSAANLFLLDLTSSCLVAIGVFILGEVGFYVEGKSKYYWSEKLNKIFYYCTKNSPEYNIISKDFTYVCLGNDEYSSEKRLKIYPRCNDLDHIVDRFSWTGSGNGGIIKPLMGGQEITSRWKSDLWTYYSIFFGGACQKKKPYDTGSKIEGMKDTGKEAVPSLGVSIDRKTRQLIMRVRFKNTEAPATATFRVISIANGQKVIHSEELSYDPIVKGFSKSIDYPRKSWKYIIAW